MTLNVDKRIFIGRIVLKESLYTKGFAFIRGFRAPQPHFALHCFGWHFQWDSTRSEQEVIKRMPEKYHYLLKAVDKSKVKE